MGFGFRHWYLRILLQVLKIGAKKNPSFALEEIGLNGLEEARKATLFIKHKGSKIQICDAKPIDFTAALVKKYQEKYGDPERKDMVDLPEVSLEAAVRLFELCQGK